jgi:hypothetical protein
VYFQLLEIIGLLGLGELSIRMTPPVMVEGTSVEATPSVMSGIGSWNPPRWPRRWDRSWRRHRRSRRPESVVVLDSTFLEVETLEMIFEVKLEYRRRR